MIEGKQREKTKDRPQSTAWAIRNKWALGIPLGVDRGQLPQPGAETRQVGGEGLLQGVHHGERHL